MIPSDMIFLLGGPFHGEQEFTDLALKELSDGSDLHMQHHLPNDWLISIYTIEKKTQCDTYYVYVKTYEEAGEPTQEDEPDPDD